MYGGKGQLKHADGHSPYSGFYIVVGHSVWGFKCLRLDTVLMAALIVLLDWPKSKTKPPPTLRFFPALFTVGLTFSSSKLLSNSCSDTVLRMSSSSLAKGPASSCYGK
jgi:hypothetical protein